MNTRIVSKEDVKIIKGKQYLPWFHNTSSLNHKVSLNKSSNVPQKVIVLDLDETLGSFADLYILWCGIRQIWPSCNDLSVLLELYPEFLRYGILTIMEYLYNSKINGLCDKILVYTNNQCSVKWVKYICNYIEAKVRERFPFQTLALFDQHICAFQINNKPIETCRTSHHKRLDDFFRCSKISENADICFIDDTEFPYMKGSAVYYICPRAYIHTLRTKDIVRRMIHSTWASKMSSQYKLLNSEDYWRNWFLIHRRRKIRRGNADVTIDLQISQKIIYHLTEFLEFQHKSAPRSPKRKTVRPPYSQLKQKHHHTRKKRTKRIQSV